MCQLLVGRQSRKSQLRQPLVGRQSRKNRSQKPRTAWRVRVKTPLFFAKDGKLLGIIAVADVIKEDSLSAIKEMQGMGLRVVMLTGDNERTAKAIGDQVGVDEVIAGVLPDGKKRLSDACSNMVRLPWLEMALTMHRL